MVAEDGALDQSLLGMTFISTLSGFDMRGDRLTRGTSRPMSALVGRSLAGGLHCRKCVAKHTQFRARLVGIRG